MSGYTSAERSRKRNGVIGVFDTLSVLVMAEASPRGPARLDLALEDLAGRPLGELVDEPDVAGVLVGGDALLDEVAQLAGGGVCAGLQRDGGGDLLAELVVRDPITAASRTSGCS